MASPTRRSRPRSAFQASQSSATLSSRSTSTSHQRFLRASVETLVKSPLGGQVPKESDLYPSDSPTALFGFELRRHRKARAWSQLRLSKMVPYSVGTISMIETAQRSPSEEFARYCDEALEAEGALMRLWPMVSRTAAPMWFRPWLDVEATAEAIRAWEPLMIPGLFQTEDYARAILSGEPGVGSEQIEEQVTARMERQSILKQTHPPMLWVVLDEGILHRPIGDSAEHEHVLRKRKVTELLNSPPEAGAYRIVPFSNERIRSQHPLDS
ncbi:helix-turn-helix domain-containing protein [Nonomuraea sp. NPDC002799]